MKTYIRISTALLALGVLLSAPLARAAEMDAATMFGTVPGFGASSISPSGRFVAFVATVGNVENVITSDLSTPGKIARTAMPNARIRNVVWHDDAHLIATISVLQKKSEFDPELAEFRHLVVIDPAGRNPPLPLFPNGESRFLDRIVNFLPNDPNHILMEVNSTINQSMVPVGPGSFLASVYTVVRVDLNTGAAEVVTRPDIAYVGSQSEIVRRFVDDRGGLIASVNSRAGAFGSRTPRLDIIIPNGGNSRSVATLNQDIEDGYIEGLTWDEKSVVLLGKRGNKTVGVYPLSLTDGKISEPLFYDPQHDAASVVLDERSQDIVGARYFADGWKIRYFSPEMRQLNERLQNTLPAGTTAEIDSVTSDYSKVLVRTSTPQTAPSLQLVNFQTGRIDTVMDAYPQLRGIPLGEAQDYAYMANDGATLHGKLVLPPGKEPHKLPLVVLPPGTNFGLSANFDFFVQYLAHQGFAVFQAGQRDGTLLSASENLAAADQWISRRQQDTANGVDDLVSKDIAEPSRMCIAGGGTMGYLALYSALVEPGKYACAINFFGLSDIKEAIKPTSATIVTKDPFTFFSASLRSNYSSYPVAGMVKLSPASRASEMRTPILLFEGTGGDLMRGQTEFMRNALNKANKPVELVSLANEDGALIRSDNRIALLSSIDKFLGEHIGH